MQTDEALQLQTFVHDDYMIESALVKSYWIIEWIYLNILAGVFNQNKLKYSSVHNFTYLPIAHWWSLQLSMRQWQFLLTIEECKICQTNFDFVSTLDLVLRINELEIHIFHKIKFNKVYELIEKSG